MDDEHAHCWHLHARHTGGHAGSDQLVCCHCGTAQSREWTGHLNQKHGQFANPRVYRYDDNGEPRMSFRANGL